MRFAILIPVAILASSALAVPVDSSNDLSRRGQKAGKAAVDAGKYIGENHASDVIDLGKKVYQGATQEPPRPPYLKPDTSGSEGAPPEGATTPKYNIGGYFGDLNREPMKKPDGK